MATTNKRLAASALSATLATYYTVPAATKTLLGALTLSNTGVAARIVTVKVSGRSLVTGRSLDAGETLAFTVPHCLEAGDLIEAKQDAGTDVDLLASGVELT